jgi:hypothetical protein
MGSANKYRFFKKHLGCGIETLFIRRENDRDQEVVTHEPS